MLKNEMSGVGCIEWLMGWN